ncbi:tetratricopeptide repeat protein [Streptomyces lanatus]|uniref:Tetratricopeptide repeat protein n=1 Tax=Streptomyces lanatus TaxID=66900 RepID=A0ABV1XS29_9ACTN|nr:tetratricopeptide repeat protein [Streptomyces lanatus]
MAAELEELRDALVRAMSTSPETARWVADLMMVLGNPGVVDTKFLEILRERDRHQFSALQALVSEQGVVNGDDATQVAGDHVDFRESAFHDRVVGVQHNHYGSVPAPAEWQPVGLVEPMEFGVRPTRHVPGLPDVPPYVPRDCDGDLWAKLAHRGLVLILGEPYAGKSYTAWQAVRSLEGHRLYVPDPGEDLRGLLAAMKGRSGRYVVWLDEVTDHLGERGLDPRLLGRITGLGAVVLGTMSPDEYYRRRTGTTPGDRVVAAARTVELPREWSEAELARLAAHEDDPRAYPAYMWSGREGAASYFAVGHLLFDEWGRVGTQLDHPRGQLLVRAAVDLARCGVTVGVPAELLKKVQAQYRAEEKESFEDALAWASAPMFGASGLLVAGERDGTWRAYGALVAEALRSGGLEPVPDEVWWTLLDAPESEAPFERDAVLDAVRAALHPRFEAGDTELMVAFARRVDGDEREAMLRRAADAGHTGAVEELASHLLDAGDEESALWCLETAARSGSVWAAREAGRLHHDLAERWLRRAAEAGDGAAAHQLGMLLRGVDNDAALHWFTRAADADYEQVATSLAGLLYNWGDLDGAEHWYRRGIALGDSGAMHDLTFLLRERGGHEEEVEALLRRAKDAGMEIAQVNLGIFLASKGAVEEAEELFRAAAAQGREEAMFQLGVLLEATGRSQSADEWYRKAADCGDHYAKRRLAERAADRSGGSATVEE